MWFKLRKWFPSLLDRFRCDSADYVVVRGYLIFRIFYFFFYFNIIIWFFPFLLLLTRTILLGMLQKYYWKGFLLSWWISCMIERLMILNLAVAYSRSARMWWRSSSSKLCFYWWESVLFKRIKRMRSIKWLGVQLGIWCLFLYRFWIFCCENQLGRSSCSCCCCQLRRNFNIRWDNVCIIRGILNYLTSGKSCC